MQSLAKALFLISLSFWCTAATSTPNELAQRARTLGVAVLPGEALNMTRIGMTVFGNKRFSTPILDSAFEDAIFGSIKTQLEYEQKYQILQVRTTGRSLSDARTAILDSLGGFSGWQQTTVPAQLKTLAQSCACDALLVVLGASDKIGNQAIGPLAWVAFTAFDQPPTDTRLYTPLVYMLVDPSSFKMAAATSSANLGISGEGAGYSNVKASLWPPAMDAVGADSWPAIIAAAREATMHSSRLPLFRIGLRPSCTSRFWQLSRVDQDRSRGVEEFQTPAPQHGSSAGTCP